MGYIIKDGTSNADIQAQLGAWTRQYAKRCFKHKNGGEYEVQQAVTINHEGQTHVGLLYFPIEKGKPNPEIPHTRSCFEFFDGRFEEIGKTEEVGK